jgi:putative endonuclease
MWYFIRHCEASQKPWQSLKQNGMDKYFIYVMSNTSNSTIYVGVTNNIERRVLEHRTPDTKSFTTRYHCHKLVYYEEYSSIDEAISREKQIKSWSRTRKDKMIDLMNPDRKDLMPQIATSLRSSQ